MRYPGAAILFASALAVSCDRIPHLKADASAPEVFIFQSSPIVVIGTVTEPNFARKLNAADHNRDLLLRFRFHVESVLRNDDGDLPGEFIVYFFRRGGSYLGSPRLGTWENGDRQVLGLRKESGVFRTACDFMPRCAMEISTGPHPEAAALAKKLPINDAITELLLTPGQNLSELKFIHALQNGSLTALSMNHAIVCLKRLSSSKSGAIHREACSILRNLEEPCTEPTPAG